MNWKQEEIDQKSVIRLTWRKLLEVCERVTDMLQNVQGKYKKQLIRNVKVRTTVIAFFICLLLAFFRSIIGCWKIIFRSRLVDKILPRKPLYHTLYLYGIGVPHSAAHRTCRSKKAALSSVCLWGTQSRDAAVCKNMYLVYISYPPRLPPPPFSRCFMLSLLFCPRSQTLSCKM